LTQVVMFGIGLVIFLPCSVISLFAANEGKNMKNVEEGVEQDENLSVTLGEDEVKIGGLKKRLRSSFHELRIMWRSLHGFPLQYWILISLQLLAWMGIWPLWTFTSSWMGQDVFGGDPDPDSPTYDDYLDGVHAGALANGLMALLNVAFSFVVVPFARKVGMKKLYFVGQMIAGVALVSCFWCQNSIVAIILISINGIQWTTNATFPYIILATYIQKSQRGFAVSVAYVVTILAQLLVSLIYGPVIALAGENFAIAFLVSGFLTLFVGFGSLGLRMRFPDPESKAILIQQDS